MRKIYKYELPVDGGIITIKQCIIKILSIQEQNGIPMMWAIVDSDNEVVEPLEIVAIGTGWELPTGLEDYLGTAQDEYGFVWHYFSLKRIHPIHFLSEESDDNGRKIPYCYNLLLHSLLQNIFPLHL